MDFDSFNINSYVPPSFDTFKAMTAGFGASDFINSAFEPQKFRFASNPYSLGNCSLPAGNVDMASLLFPNINLSMASMNFFPSFTSRFNTNSINYSNNRPNYSGDSRYQLRQSEYSDMVVRIATEEGVDPNLYLSLVQNESGFNPKADSGEAFGLAQLTKGAADEVGVDMYDPEDNVRGGARYFKKKLDEFGGNIELALAAYNAGAGAVKKAGGIPQNGETPEYVARVMATYNSTSSPKPEIV